MTRVGIVGHCLQEDSAFRGIGRALMGLLTAMHDCAPGHAQISLLVDRNKPFEGLSEISLIGSEDLNGHGIGYDVLHFPQQPRLMGREKMRRALDPLHLSLIHLPAQFHLYGKPYLTVPYVATIHDVIPFVIKDTMNLERKFRHRKQLKRLKENCMRAAAVMTVSEHTKRDCVRVLGIPEERITVVPNGVDSRFSPITTNSIEILQKYGIHEPYFFSVGAWGRNKNVDTLLDSFRRFRKKSEQETKLVIAGKAFWGDTLPGPNTNIEGDVVFTGFVDDDDLPTLYSKAEALVNLSTYEGFCLPALEAMACGTPVIASSTTVFPETVGDAGILVDPLNPDEAAKAMCSIINEPLLVADLRERGLERASRYTWKRAAEATLAVYQKVLASLPL
jgi:glycosyltransferase involved in cell wall biosynthesis